MPNFDPETLASWTGGSWSGLPAIAPTGFSADTRQLLRGQAFVALRSERRDGHDFLAAAANAGATAALVARADPGAGLPQLVVADPLSALQAVAREHRRTFRGKVTAVTGSAGKTSTKEILCLLLGGAAGGVLATRANLNNHIGVALTLTQVDPAIHHSAVVEAGISGPGEMRTLAAMIEPDIVIVTLIGPAHLEELGGLDGVAREKAVLAESIREGGTCIIASSCEAFPAFKALAGAGRIVVEPVDFLGGEEPPPGRCRFSVSHSGESTAVSVAFAEHPRLALGLRRVSDGMAQNVALAACAALTAGATGEEIQSRLLSWRPSSLRGEWRTSGGLNIYLDCYNANPASMADALSAFNSVAPAADPRLYVIGCMEELGADARRYHLELGRSLALREQDHAIIVGGLAQAVRQGAIEQGSDAAQIEVAESIDGISGRLASFRGSVFVKGSRRHQLERAFAGAEFAEASHA